MIIIIIHFKNDIICFAGHILKTVNGNLFFWNMKYCGKTTFTMTVKFYSLDNFLWITAVNAIDVFSQS